MFPDFQYCLSFRSTRVKIIRYGIKSSLVTFVSLKGELISTFLFTVALNISLVSLKVTDMVFNASRDYTEH